MHRMEIMNAGEMTHSQGIRESPREDGALGNRIEVKIGKDSRGGGSCFQVINLIGSFGRGKVMGVLCGRGRGPNSQIRKREVKSGNVLAMKWG